MFLVKVSKKAGKSAIKMPEHYKKRIKELLLNLESEPVPAKLYDTKNWKGAAANIEYELAIYA